MRALVTGADGFVGRWLIEHLRAHGDDVWLATGSRRTSGPRQRPVDLTAPGTADELVAWARPDAVYHLAAVAFGPDAAARVEDAIDLTVRASASLLKAAASMSSPPIVFIPSSAEVYGAASPDGPLTESDPIAPANLYGATKAAQELIGLAFHRLGQVEVAVARAFNHIGPGQRQSFVVPSFAGQLAAISGGAAPVLRVGNLQAQRDFLDVRDVVRAYRMLVAGRHSGEPLNVASSVPRSIASILDRLIELSGLAVEVLVDPERFRPNDIPLVVGDSSRLRSLTGWQPDVDFDSTLRDVWADALDRTAQDREG